MNSACALHRTAGRRLNCAVTIMNAVIESVVFANSQFYRALSLADLGAMQRLWLESPDAACTHPNGETLQGWEAIRESWRVIFENQGPLQVWASDVAVRVYGQTAEVTCRENIDTSRAPGGGLAQARAANVFRRMAGQWKMLEHHATPIPVRDRLRRPARFSPN